MCARACVQVQDRLAEITEVEYYPLHSVIFREGDPGTALYLLIEGKVKMTKTVVKGRGRMGSGGTRVLATLTAQSEQPWFGELALWESRATRPFLPSPALLLPFSAPPCASPHLHFPCRSRSRAPPPPRATTPSS